MLLMMRKTPDEKDDVIVPDVDDVVSLSLS